MNPSLPFFHAPGAIEAGGSGGEMIGNPMYDILPGHEIAVVAVMALPIVAWWLSIRAADGSARATRLVSGYRALAPIDRLATWAMAASAALHLSLAPGHGGLGMAVAFGLQAGALAFVIRRALLGRSWRALGALVLIGSVLAYAVAMVGGDLPDQVGLATKMIELLGLAAILRGATAGRRVRRVAGWAVVTALVVVTSLGGWIGAFRAAGGIADHHDEAMAFPGPGSVMPVMLTTEATPEQADAAADLHAELVAALARYTDPAVAAADGYQVDGLYGTDFHAENPAYTEDGRILDQQRPEDLIYASTPSGPVLLGAMFTVPFGQSGPMIGGPITMWHAHEHVCIGLLPPGLSGLLSPLGGCPAGSFDVPITNEMIHAWVVPGAPQQWGDLDDAWRDAYLSRFVAGR